MTLSAQNVGERNNQNRHAIVCIDSKNVPSLVEKFAVPRLSIEGISNRSAFIYMCLKEGRKRTKVKKTLKSLRGGRGENREH